MINKKELREMAKVTFWFWFYFTAAVMSGKLMYLWVRLIWVRFP
jgi:hypothetical protein